jgi:hypothetical protein
VNGIEVTRDLEVGLVGWQCHKHHWFACEQVALVGEQGKQALQCAMVLDVGKNGIAVAVFLVKVDGANFDKLLL